MEIASLDLALMIFINSLVCILLPRIITFNWLGLLGKANH